MNGGFIGTFVLRIAGSLWCIASLQTSHNGRSHCEENHRKFRLWPVAIQIPLTIMSRSVTRISSRYVVVIGAGFGHLTHCVTTRKLRCLLGGLPGCQSLSAALTLHRKQWEAIKVSCFRAGEACGAREANGRARCLTPTCFNHAGGFRTDPCQKLWVTLVQKFRMQQRQLGCASKISPRSINIYACFHSSLHRPGGVPHLSHCLSSFEQSCWARCH